MTNDATPTQYDDTLSGGPWTSHGHAIAGVTVHGTGKPRVARCGGPRHCPVCGPEAAAAQASAR